MPPIVEETQLEGSRMTKFTCIQSFVPLVFALAAIIVGTAPSFVCETLEFTQTEGNILLVGPLSYRTRDASEWADSSFASQNCRNYGETGGLGFEYDVDSKTRTVWAFSILTPLLGATLIVKSFFNIISASCGPACGGSKCLGAFYLLTCVFQGLVLLITSSSLCTDNPAIQYLEATNTELASTFPETCQVSAGYAIQIAAVALWALAGLTTFWLKEPVVAHKRPKQEQTVTYTQNLEGVVEESHVTVVKGTPVEQRK